MSRIVSPVVAGEPQFHFQFNALKANTQRRDNTCLLELPLPLLGGPETAALSLPGAKIIDDEGHVLLLETPDLIVGAVVAEEGERLEEPVRAAYLEVLRICSSRQLHLHRVWNYVPYINKISHGLEQYRQFNIGRWMAFEELFGRDLRAFMPAASAVGIQGNQAAIFFIAGKTHPVYLENPSQVPAYHYPTEYGPLPPSFARAVLVRETAETTGYLSGTASIEGHRSVGEGDWHLQFRTTMHNVQIMLERMEMLDVIQTPKDARTPVTVVRDFRCYLRHAEMLPLVQEWLAEEAPRLAERAIYQLADICRKELDLEVEAVFTQSHH